MPGLHRAHRRADRRRGRAGRHRPSAGPVCNSRPQALRLRPVSQRNQSPAGGVFIDVRWPPGDSGFAANVAITVLATRAIGSVAYAGMVRALHPIAVAFPAASPSPTHLPSISPLPATPAPNPIPAPPPSSSLLALVDLDITDFSTACLLLSNCTPPPTGSCHYPPPRTLLVGP